MSFCRTPASGVFHVLRSPRRPRPGRTPTDPETKSCTRAVRFQKYFIFWNSHNVSALGGLSPRGSYDRTTRHTCETERWPCLGRCIKWEPGRTWAGQAWAPQACTAPSMVTDAGAPPGMSLSSPSAFTRRRRKKQQESSMAARRGNAIPQDAIYKAPDALHGVPPQNACSPGF